MINILNSESIYIGTDMVQFNNVRDVLDAQHIKYKYKVKNHLTDYTGHGTVRSYTGSAGNSSQNMYEYEILIHKKDLEQAKYYLSQH